MSSEKSVRNMKRRLARAGVTSEALNSLGEDDVTLCEEIAATATVDAGSETSPVKPSYSGVAYSGNLISQPGWPHKLVVDIKGVVIAKNPMPALYNHDVSQPVGHHMAVLHDDHISIEEGVFSVPGEARDKILDSVRAGFNWEYSIRGPINKVRKVPKGRTEIVNGRKFTGPFFVVDSMQLREVSVTSLGADSNLPNASIAAKAASNLAADAAQPGEDVMSDESPVEPKETEEIVASEEAVVEAPEVAEATEETPAVETEVQASEEAVVETPAEEVAVEAAPEVETPEAEVAASESAEEPSALEAYVAAQNEIAAGQAQIDLVNEIFGGDDVYASLRASAAAEGWDRETCEREKNVSDETRKAPQGFVARDIEASADMGSVLACSMAIEAGVREDSPALDSYSDEVRDLAASAEYRGMSWHSVIGHTARAHNRSMRIGASGNDIMAAAAELDRLVGFKKATGEIAASGGQGWSTLDLASLTADVMNKVLYDRFRQVNSLVDTIASVGSARDFRPHHRYRLSGGGFMSPIAKNGEITHKNFSQTQFSNEIGTVASMVSVPREAIINDDLGVLRQIGEEFGRGAAKTLERDLFTALHAAMTWTAANQISDVFGPDGLDAALDLFIDLEDSDGTPIDVQPSVLLVQSGSMYREALELIGATTLDNTQTDSGSNNRLVSGNTLQGVVDKVVHSPWLKNPNVTGNSSTAWYLMTNPAELAVLEVLFLNGKRSPTIERGDTTFNTLGAQWRAYWDYGIGTINDTGIVRSTGAG